MKIQEKKTSIKSQNSYKNVYKKNTKKNTEILWFLFEILCKIASEIEKQAFDDNYQKTKKKRFKL